MTDKEVNLLMNKLQKFRAKLASSEEESKKFLINAGIITEKCNLKAQYRNLYIPPDQD